MVILYQKHLFLSIILLQHAESFNSPVGGEKHVSKNTPIPGGTPSFVGANCARDTS